MTRKKSTQATDRQELETLLDVYGADRTRWPARERLRFASIISEDEAAQRLVAETAALDALLDRAPQAGEGQERALKERIMAAALAAPREKPAVVTTLRSPSRLPAWAERLANVKSNAKVATKAEWPAGALLAASLVVGVMLGSAGTFETTAQEVAAATGFGAGDASQLAVGLGDEIITSGDEDLL